MTRLVELQYRLDARVQFQIECPPSGIPDPAASLQELRYRTIDLCGFSGEHRGDSETGS